MASLVLKMSVSLDGYAASSDGSNDWMTVGRSEDSTSWVLDTVRGAGAHLVGATTYAEFASFWPGAAGPFAAPMNEIPKGRLLGLACVRRLGRDGHRRRRSDEGITRLKRERSNGYLLAQGGVRIARSLVDTGLIDECRLVVHPVVLGGGGGTFPHRSQSSRRVPSPSAAESWRTPSGRSQAACGRAGVCSLPTEQLLNCCTLLWPSRRLESVATRPRGARRRTHGFDPLLLRVKALAPSPTDLIASGAKEQPAEARYPIAP